MSFAPVDNEGELVWTNVTARMAVRRLSSSLALLPSLREETRKLQVLTRAYQWETCRSMLTLYDWLAHTGPALAKALFDTHRHNGLSGVKKLFPGFENLVDHIVTYLQHLRDAIHSKKASKRPRSSENQPSLNDENQPPAWREYCEVPSDLFGLCQSTSKTAVKLPEFKAISPSDDSLYKKAQQCFLKIWDVSQIAPNLVEIDKHFNGPRTRSQKTDDIIGRNFGRAYAVHLLLQQQCPEGILASEAVHVLLTSPSLAFPPHASHDAQLFAAFKRDQAGFGKKVSDWISCHLKAHPDVIQRSHELGKFVHHQLCQLGLGKIISLEQYHSPDAVPTYKPPSSSTTAKAKKKVSYTPVKIGMLLRNGHPQFGILALILRESLGEQRGVKFINQSLRWVLEGKHPTRGYVEPHYHRDQTDPIRHRNRQTTLFQDKVPSIELTKPGGLAHILVYYGTGQGGPTEQFLHNTDMVSLDLDHCVKKFSDAKLLMENKIDQYLVDDDHGGYLTSGTGCMQIDNPRVWGQPSNFLGLTPTAPEGEGPGGRLTIRQKLAPYYEPKLHTHWTTFLGELAGLDPETYTGHLKSWDEGVDFFEDLGVPPFNSGLTPMQVANTLVFRKVLSPPSPGDMALWIAIHPDLGAVAGLEAMGFDTSSDSTIMAAFMCTYHFLEKHLTAADKQLFNFGAIFVEHVLCKVGRWIGRLGNLLDLKAMGREAELGSEWKDGANVEDPHCFPIPLKSPLQHLEEILITLPVRVLCLWLYCYHN